MTHLHQEALPRIELFPAQPRNAFGHQNMTRGLHGGLKGKLASILRSEAEWCAQVKCLYVALWVSFQHMETQKTPNEPKHEIGAMFTNLANHWETFGSWR